MSEKQSLLVIGAGIAGITAALEAAESGAEVTLVERDPSVGGRVLRINNYFPKMCPPSCGMEINIRRLERNPRIRVMTNSRVTGGEQKDGGWAVEITTSPAFVKANCTACGDCEKACYDRGPGPAQPRHVQGEGNQAAPRQRLAEDLHFRPLRGG